MIEHGRFCFDDCHAAHPAFGDMRFRSIALLWKVGERKLIGISVIADDRKLDLNNMQFLQFFFVQYFILGSIFSWGQVYNLFNVY